MISRYSKVAFSCARLLNMPIVYSFCKWKREFDYKSSNALSQNHRRSDQQQGQGRMDTIENFCKRVMNWQGRQVSDLTNKSILKQYEQISKEKQYSHFNFVLAFLYSKDPSFFQGYFDEQALDSLLRVYEDSEFSNFFNNFILASCIICEMPQDHENHKIYQFLYNYIRNSKNNTSNENFLKQAQLILSVQQKHSMHREYNTFRQQFLPQYLERALQINHIFEKQLSQEEVFLALVYFEYEHEINKTSALSNIEQRLSLADFSQKYICNSYTKGFHKALANNGKAVLDNPSIFLHYLEKSLLLLGENHQLNNMQIVKFYHTYRKLIYLNSDSAQNTRILLLLDKLLEKKQFQNNELRSLFFSFLKISFKSPNVVALIKAHLENDQLSQNLSKKDSDNFFRNLILVATNLRILTKDQITPQLNQQIFQIASTISNPHEKSFFLSAFGLSFLRIEYFNQEFWLVFLKEFPQDQSFFQRMLFDTLSVFYEDLSQEIQNAIKQLVTLEEEKIKEAEQPIIFPEDDLVKNYLDELNISYVQSKTVGGICVNFILEERKKSIFIFKSFHYIINQDGKKESLSVKSEFKIKALTKKGFQAIILDVSEPNLKDQLISQLEN